MDTTAATDMISYTLGEIGVEGIEIEDHVPLTEDEKRQMYVDILPDTEPDDGTAVINFYRDEDENPEEFLVKVNAALDGLRSFMDIGGSTTGRNSSTHSGFQTELLLSQPGKNPLDFLITKKTIL